MLCSSCKNKNSTEQCRSNAIKGLLFCGKHLNMKEKKLWCSVTQNNKYALIIQKVWRGFFCRNLIKLAGEGVLNRSKCHNEEELVTLQSKTSLSPNEYFSITESEKLYWFSISSINQWTRTNMTNPYTRQPLEIKDRIRLRELCRIKRKFNSVTLHQPDNKVDSKWVEICQIIEENGFFDMNPLFFQELNRVGLFHLMSLILTDLIAYASGNRNRQSYVNLVKAKLKNYKNVSCNFSERVANTLLFILYDCVNNYDICFIIVSARCRL